MNQDVSKMESYSKAFAEKVCNSFFSVSDSIRGEQILSQTPIDQVNLFVVRNIFNRWKEEIQNLKSPYFDYESSEVKQALSSFGNTLSKHILIKKEFFRPLLEKAVFDTLLLLLKPSLFFKNEFLENSLILEDLKEKQKYYRIHKSFLDPFIRDAAREIYGRDFITAFEDWIVKNPLKEEERDSYFKKFAEVLPFEISKEATEAVKFEIPKPEQKEFIHEEPKHAEPELVTVEKKLGNEEQQRSFILNEKFSANQTTINDLLRENQSRSLADKISRSKLENLRAGISLNQKFRFINFLFKGSGAEYDGSLNGVETCSSYEEALNFLNNNYAIKYDWDFNDPEVKEFIEIVERKFS
jgi:hypothetical protein